MGSKFLFRVSWNCIFFKLGFSRSNKHDTFWHVVSIRYFYVLFLWAIAVWDFRRLEIYKSLSLSWSTTTFTVNSNANNHFHKYIYLFQIYSMKSVFLLKFTLRYFYIQIWLKCETPLWFFLIKNMVKKIFFSVDCSI